MKYSYALVINIMACTLNLVIAYLQYGERNKHSTIFFATVAGFALGLVATIVAVMCGLLMEP